MPFSKNCHPHILNPCLGIALAGRTQTHTIRLYSQVIGELEAVIQLLSQSFKVSVEFADNRFRLWLILTIHTVDAIIN